MENNKRFIWRQKGEFSGQVFDTLFEVEVCSIKNISLLNARFKPHGQFIIGESVPMPLFWWQYANHEDPERNTGIPLRMNVQPNKEKITVEIYSTNKSNSIQSNYLLELAYSAEDGTYIYSITARLKVNEDCQWIITHNPVHGEIEYCNFYPENVFSKRPQIKKKYFCCAYENKKGDIIQIPHCHLELDSYRNLNFKESGKFYYLLENENPVIQLMDNTDKMTYAGICSYMWDSHFGYRLNNDKKEYALTDTTSFEASFRLFSITKDKGYDILEKSIEPDLKQIKSIPVYHKGVNTFSEKYDPDTDQYNIWPWQTELLINGKLNDSNTAEFFIDDKFGFNDDHSLCIKLRTEGAARWIYTCLGPDFGEEEFKINKKYLLNAKIRSMNLGLNSFIRLGFRIHYKDDSSLFNFENYEYWFSDKIPNSLLENKMEWIDCVCTTPVLLKIPDRVHLLLELNGEGECWFDDVLYEQR